MPKRLSRSKRKLRHAAAKPDLVQVLLNAPRGEPLCLDVSSPTVEPAPTSATLAAVKSAKSGKVTEVLLDDL